VVGRGAGGAAHNIPEGHYFVDVDDAFVVHMP
jgi:hypothetical protein